MENLHSVQSESDEDIALSKQSYHYVSSDSDLQSYDISSRHGKESASRMPYKKKSHKMIFSLLIPWEHKCIVWFTYMYWGHFTDLFILLVILGKQEK